MDPTTIDGTTGDWGPTLWVDPTGTVPNNGPAVQSASVLDQSTVTQGSDQWSGVFANLLGTVTNYAIAKDAAKSGIRTAVAPNGQPTYTAAAPKGNVLVLGLIVIAGVLLARKA